MDGDGNVSDTASTSAEIEPDHSAINPIESAAASDAAMTEPSDDGQSGGRVSPDIDERAADTPVQKEVASAGDEGSPEPDQQSPPPVVGSSNAGAETQVEAAEDQGMSDAHEPATSSSKKRTRPKTSKDLAPGDGKHGGPKATDALSEDQSDTALAKRDRRRTSPEAAPPANNDEEHATQELPDDTMEVEQLQTNVGLGENDPPAGALHNEDFNLSGNEQAADITMGETGFDIDTQLEDLLNCFANADNGQPGDDLNLNFSSFDAHLEEAQEAVEDEEASANFKKAERAYKRKAKNKENTALDDIQFKKLQIEDRKRKAAKHEREKVAQENESANPTAEESLFVPNVRIETPPRNFEDESEVEEQPAHKKRKTKPAKPAKKKDKAEAKGKQKKDTGGKKTRHTKSKAQIAANTANLKTVAGANVFASAHTNKGRPDQPTMQSKKKEEAITELIASIPEENLITAKIDVKHVREASKKFGFDMCKSGPNGWMIKGMISGLEHYQMLGASFMRSREAFDRDGVPICKPQGGLNCDQMGLGKTVMAIAVIASDRYKDSKRVNGNVGKPTLIVAPSSLLYQWRDELYKHAEKSVIGSVYMLQAGSSKDDQLFMESQGVVLTSYSQVAKSYPKKDPPVELVTAEAKKQWWDNHFQQHRGLLHQVKWRRIILDEATCIKNFRSKTSLACSELKAEFRWALSGTPAMNSIDEFYSYFRFLQVEEAGSFKLFKKNFVNDAEGKERLVAMLRPLMLRRTHDDKLFGAKLLNLPLPTRDTYPCQLDDLHAAVYRIVKERFVETINVISRKGELKSGNVLTLLLRLRQFVGHPLLIQDCIRDLLDETDFKKIEAVFQERQRNKDFGKQQQRIIQHMRRMLADRDNLPELDTLSDTGVKWTKSPQKKANGSEGGSPETTVSEAVDRATSSPLREQSSAPSGNADEAPQTEANTGQALATDEAPDVTKDNEPDPQASIGGSFGLKDDFVAFIKQLREEGKVKEVGQRIMCARCNKPPKNPIVTSCQHTYCHDCVVEDSREGIENKQDRNLCKACGNPYTTTERYEPEELEHELYDKNMAAHGPLIGKTPKDTTKMKPSDIINQWIDKDGFMLPSSKTTAFKAQVLNWLHENSDVKIIVYTQFVSMMHILARICDIEKWQYLLYHGGLTITARNNTIKRFDQEQHNILFATLSTGGVGLNLTMATKVIMIDPWWNSAVEQQAFCRTYRRGQDKRTAMMRLAARETVDEHILKLQAKKDAEILSVMGEEAMKTQLGLSELMRLFGDVGEDENGNPFIYPEGRRGNGPLMPVEESEDAGMGTEL